MSAADDSDLTHRNAAHEADRADQIPRKRPTSHRWGLLLCVLWLAFLPVTIKIHLAVGVFDWLGAAITTVVICALLFWYRAPRHRHARLCLGSVFVLLAVRSLQSGHRIYTLSGGADKQWIGTLVFGVLIGLGAYRFWMGAPSQQFYSTADKV